MSVFRVKKTKDYTIMSNIHLREKNMSLKAKGLLSYMLSLPDDWDYSILGLTKVLKESKDSIMSALKELEDFNYLKRTPSRDKKGRFKGYDYDVFETPQDTPYSDYPYSENPPQINTNITNNLNKEKEIYKEKETYGLYENVFLSKEEYKKLKEKVENLEVLIESLSLYQVKSKKNYKSHYLTLLKWNSKEEKEKEKSSDKKKKESEVYNTF